MSHGLQDQSPKARTGVNIHFALPLREFPAGSLREHFSLSNFPVLEFRNSGAAHTEWPQGGSEKVEKALFEPIVGYQGKRVDGTKNAF